MGFGNRSDRSISIHELIHVLGNVLGYDDAVFTAEQGNASRDRCQLLVEGYEGLFEHPGIELPGPPSIGLDDRVLVWHLLAKG